MTHLLYSLTQTQTDTAFYSLGWNIYFIFPSGLEKYQEAFQEHEIDLPLLLTMTDEELREVGITKLGPRRKLTAAIGRIKEQRKGDKT